MASFEVKNLFEVKGKVVLITGGSRGIGKMIAAGFVKNGAKVYITSRSKEECDSTAKELSARSDGPDSDSEWGSCISIPTDLQELSEVERLVAEISKREKRLHVLVNNAGAAWGDPIDRYPDSAFSKLLMLNLQRVFTLTQRCLPLLREAALEGGKVEESWKDPARIINIGSIEAIRIQPHETFAYSASKAGLHHLSRHLAGRLGWEGITSNTIACGPFESKMMSHNLKHFRDAIIESIPLTRIGTPEDIAGTALFLASRAGAYVNGATITLDGGSVVTTKAKL